MQKWFIGQDDLDQKIVVLYTIHSLRHDSFISLFWILEILGQKFYTTRQTFELFVQREPEQRNDGKNKLEIILIITRSEYIDNQRVKKN